MPEFSYILKDRLYKQMNDKNVSFYICLLHLCYVSSGFFRGYRTLKLSEKVDLHLNHLLYTGRDLGKLLTQFKPQFIHQLTEKSIMLLRIVVKVS